MNKQPLPAKGEIWVKLHNSEHHYVSNFGRMWTNLRGCRILRGWKDSVGYRKVTISGKNEFVHRFVAIAFIPNPENKPQVNHKDGNKLNNAVSNLEWVTDAENKQHAKNTGLMRGLKGSRNHFSKLSEVEVVAIKKISKIND